MSRAYYIDNIRILLNALVIVHHSAIAYGASGGWCYISPDTIEGWSQLLFSAFLSVNQAFFMSLFFFISALFTSGSFDRKGWKKYLTDRFTRLGMPLLVYSLLINPILSYCILLHQDNVNVNLFNFILEYNITNPNTSHMWFVLALLIFESIYAFYRVTFASKRIYKSDKLPSPLKMFWFILTTGLLAFLLRTIYPVGGKNFIGLQFGYFVLYIAMYVIGIIANRKKWLDQITLDSYKTWIITAFITIPLIVLIWIYVTANPDQIIYFTGGFNFKALFYAYWEAIVCVGLCIFILTRFKEYFNNFSLFTVKTSADTYIAYIIHPIIVVSITMFLEAFAIYPIYKLSILAIFSVLLSFLLGHMIIMIPGINQIL